GAGGLPRVERRGHHDDLEAVLLTQLAKRVDVSGATLAELEVGPCDDAPRVAGADEDLLDEDARLGRRELGVEGLHDDLVASGLAQELGATGRRGEQRGRALRRENSRR